MGSQRLKKKIELNYRRGSTCHHCGVCDFYYPEFDTPQFGSGPTKKEPRCRIIGLLSGRAYRIHPNHICDAYDNTQRLAQLTGEKP